MSEAPAPEPDDGGTPAEAPTETPAEAAKRRMREALERKKGVTHPDDGARGGTGVHGRSAGTTRREFRRKSG